MLDGAPIAWWIGFHAVVLVLIVADLAVLGRGKASSQTLRNFLFVLFLFALAACFGVWIGHVEGHQTGLEFASGYLIELSLSIDNLFVFLLMFRSFGLAAEDQRKALLLGILGAIVMRGVFIFSGIKLLERFTWIQYLFGAILVVAAVRLLLAEKQKKAGEPPTPANQITRWTKGLGKSPRMTFLLAVVAIELVDLVFAIDSVPAVLAISHHPFVVYTSNILAILGLRSLYFLLAGMLERLHYLHFGLAAILAFVGCKMLLGKWIKVPVEVSLGIIVVVIVVATVASLVSSTHRAHESTAIR